MYVQWTYVSFRVWECLQILGAHKQKLAVVVVVVVVVVVARNNACTYVWRASLSKDTPGKEHQTDCGRISNWNRRVGPILSK